MKSYATDRSHVPTFRERITLLLDRLAFRRALLEISQHDRWREDAEALCLVGLVMHRFAPRSTDRACAYGIARNFYRAAARRSRDRGLRAGSLAQIGHTYFEEGALDNAFAAFEQSASLVADHCEAHLGLLAVACAKRDDSAIRSRAQDLVERIPDWHKDHETVQVLATNPDYAFLRASDELFFDCFGGFPRDLAALFDQHKLHRLRRALTRLACNTEDELEDSAETRTIIKQTFAKMGPILKVPSLTLAGVPIKSIQNRLGF